MHFYVPNARVNIPVKEILLKLNTHKELHTVIVGDFLHYVIM